MKMKRLLSIILCLCMFVAIFSMSATADGENIFEPIGNPSGDPIEPPAGDFSEPPAGDSNEPPAGDFSEPPAGDFSQIPAGDFSQIPAPASDPAPLPNPLSISGILTTGTSTVYNGTDQIGNVTFVVTDSNGTTLRKGTDYTVEREAVFRDAKTYSIVAVGIGGTNYEGLRSEPVYYTITPATISIAANNASKTFGDNDPTLTYNVAPEHAAMITGTPSREAGEGAGTYSIGQGTLASTSSNYIISFTPASFTINAKPISPSAVVSPATFTYTGNELCPSVTVYTDNSKTTMLDPSEYTVSYSNNTNVGTAGFTVTAAANGNYSFSSFGGSFVIAKADPVYTEPSAIPGLKYDGSVQQLVYPGDVESAGCSISYSNSRNGTYLSTVPKGQQIGTYEVWWMINGGNNYNNVGPYKITVSITKYTAGDEVADMIRGLSWLPGGQVDPGNEHQRNEVLKVWNAYHNLSYSEQQKVPANLYNWLYNLVSNTDYAIIAGNGSTWYKGKSTGISFTAIDPVGKFAGVRVDGNLIDSSNYWYSGEDDTCVVTLKPAYLTTLGFGKHNISICYWNGYAPGHFYIMEASGSPPTGDSANFPLWGSMILLSGLGLAAAGIVLKRKKEN